jgi:ribosome recycling factor
MSIYLQKNQGEFENVIDFFKKDISNLRTGRANPNVLDAVQVDAYGTKQPLSSSAGITVPDGRSIVISPWDKSIAKDIEKALTEANLGFGIVNEGDRIRLSVPSMTEENRKEIVKKLNEKMEAARVKVRQAREEIKSDIETAHDQKEISEDDKFRFIKELDEEVTKRNNELKELRDKKEKEIMTI